jgi:hypothetical protein
MNPIRGDLAIVWYCMALLFCLLFSSCTRRQVSTHVSGTEKQSGNQHYSTFLDTVIQQEAMLVDIPIPLYDHRILPTSYDETERDTLVFGYKSPLDHNQAVEFFINQMERLGWRHLVSFDTYSESILQFKSPDRYCTVVVQKSEKESVGSSIFIYIKRASTDARSQ